MAILSDRRILEALEERYYDAEEFPDEDKYTREEYDYDFADSMMDEMED